MNRLILENLSIKLREISLSLADDGGTGAAYAATIALADLVIFEMGSQLYPSYAPSAPPPEPEPAKRTKGKRAPKGQGAHRHKFGADGVCILGTATANPCGATRQRAPKGSAKPDAEARTIPLPTLNSRAPIGEHALDKFDGGAFGSSGTGDRR